MDPVVIDPTPRLFLEDENLWERSLRYFLYTNILPLAIPNVGYTFAERNNIAKKLINTKEAAVIWVRGFTHPSYDRNPGKNYDRSEFGGDGGAGHFFTKFLMKIFPNITEGMLNNLKATYMAKVEMRNKSRKLGLSKWVRIIEDVTIHVDEDLFESLFGSLNEIGDLIFGNGNGDALCMNMMVNLYKDDNISIDGYLNKPKSQIKEIFEKMDWISGKQLNPREISTIERLPSGNRNKWKITIKFTQKAFDNLKKYDDIKQPASINLAIVEGSSKAAVENEAYFKALENLKSLGISLQWASRQKEKELEQQYKLLYETARNNGYQSIIFSKKSQSGNNQYLQLIGITDLGVYDILLTVRSNADINILDLKKFIENVYFELGKQPKQNIIEYDPDFKVNL